MSDRRYALLLVAVTAAHFGLAAVLPPAEDELYYWCWAQELQPSYYDHPPAAAWLVRLSTAVFGDSVFAVRFPACLTSLGAVLAIGWLTGRRLVGWLLLTPVFTFGAVLLTPDAPLILMWSLYAAWLVRVHRRLDAGDRLWAADWLAGGLLLGLGLLSKYTMALTVPCAALAFLLARGRRDWVAGFAGHLAVAGLMATPILVYNWSIDFAPLRFQWAHATSTDSGFSAKRLGEFVGVQFVFVGTAPFVLAAWAAARWRVLAADPLHRVCLCLYLPPLAFFTAKAAVGRVEANWPVVCYLTFWPLALAWWDRLADGRLKRLAWPAGFAVPVVASAVVAVHLAWPILLGPKQDRLTRLKSQFDLSEDIAVAVRERGGDRVYALTYQWTSYLRFRHLDARQVPGVCRASHFTTKPQSPLADAEVLMLTDEKLPREFMAGFGPPEVLQFFPVMVRGTMVNCYALVRYRREV